MTAITDPVNREWLDAIAKHPETTDWHVLAACELLGADPGPGEPHLTDERRTALVAELAALGFTR